MQYCTIILDVVYEQLLHTLQHIAACGMQKFHAIIVHETTALRILNTVRCQQLVDYCHKRSCADISVCLPSLVLVARVVFVLECGQTHTHIDTHAHRITDATDYAIYASATAWVRNEVECVLLYRRYRHQRSDKGDDKPANGCIVRLYS